MPAEQWKVGELARRTGFSVRTLHHAEINRGNDPSDSRVQKLAHRWRGLIVEFTGGNPEIAHSLRTMYQNEPQARERTGMDPDLQAYVDRMLAAGE